MNSVCTLNLGAETDGSLQFDDRGLVLFLARFSN